MTGATFDFLPLRAVIEASFDLKVASGGGSAGGCLGPAFEGEEEATVAWSEGPRSVRIQLFPAVFFRFRTTLSSLLAILVLVREEEEEDDDKGPGGDFIFPTSA